MNRELAVLLAVLFVGALLARIDPTASFSFHPGRATANPGGSACPPNQATR